MRPDCAPSTLLMQIYLVGGAVRDGLLGHYHLAHRRPDGSVHADRDWVVVGATPEQMRAQGYLPVGRDFPVFLHPHTHEEYALPAASIMEQAIMR